MSTHTIERRPGGGDAYDSPTEETPCGMYAPPRLFPQEACLARSASQMDVFLAPCIVFASIKRGFPHVSGLPVSRRQPRGARTLDSALSTGGRRSERFLCSHPLAPIHWHSLLILSILTPPDFSLVRAWSFPSVPKFAGLPFLEQLDFFVHLFCVSRQGVTPTARSETRIR